MDGVRAAVGIVDAVNLLKALVPPLLVNTLVLRRLIEDGRQRFRVILHKLHVLEDYRERKSISQYCMLVFKPMKMQKNHRNKLHELQQLHEKECFRVYFGAEN